MCFLVSTHANYNVHNYFTQSSVAALAYGDVLRSREEGHLMAYPAAAKNMIGTGNSSSQKNT